MDRYELVENDRFLVFTPYGALSERDYPETREAIQMRLTIGKELVLNLDFVDFLCSPGITFIMKLKDLAMANCSGFCIGRTSPQVLKVIDALRLSRILNVKRLSQKDIEGACDAETPSLLGAARC